MNDSEDTLRKIEAAVRALASDNPLAAREIARARPVLDFEAHMRILEALLFAAAEPLDIETLRARMPAGADVSALLQRLQNDYEERGVHLTRVAGRWRLQTAPDLAPHLVEERVEPKKLSQAALETLAIIAYHQPVARSEIEEVRGVAVSKGTLDHLLEIGWVKPKGRRRSPGRPVVYGTTDAFLAHFGLDALDDLPGKDELKAAGLLDSRIPADFDIPEPGRARRDDLIEEAEPEDGAFHTDFMEEE